MKVLYIVFILLLLLGAGVMQVGAESYAMDIFPAAEYLGDGWLWSAWFGYLADLGYGWIWHLADGVDGNLMYAAGAESTGIWFYNPLDGGWYWTRSDIFPGFYNYQTKAWVNAE